MKSRLLAKLEEIMRSQSGDPDFYRAKAKVAAHYGKLGETAAARAMLSEIRAQPRAITDPTVVSLVNLAEGVIAFRSGESELGVDKWTRARAIASSVNFCEGASLAAAWLAFAAYLREDVAGMGRCMRSALSEGCERQPQAMSRLSLTMALCFHYCGDLLRARKFYRISHRSATECGDEVELSALIHDMSTMLIHQKRVASFAEFNDLNADMAALSNLASADSYEELIGIKSLPSLSPQLAAYEAVLGGRWLDAIDLINRTLESAAADGYARLMPALLADRALCHQMLHEASAAEADIEQSLKAYDLCDPHRDDRAFYFSRLCQLYRLMGDESTSAHYAQLARAAWGLVKQFQAEMRATVTSIDEQFE